MNYPHYCSLCGCICVACAQLEDGCDSCELLHPELLDPELLDPELLDQEDSE